MKNIYNKDLIYQRSKLIEIIINNSIFDELLNKLENLTIPKYYIGAGCVAQTIWNYLSDFPLLHGINDIDIAFFDNENITIEYENKIIDKIKSEFSNLKTKLDIKNQARVHLWYKEKFGYNIAPIISLEDGINRWPTTATSIGIRKEDNNYNIYAPYGLNDIFNKIVRANKIQITKKIMRIK
jgi:uncharacterized protein